LRFDTNEWNRARYTLWAPVYDLIGRAFDPMRRESLRRLGARAGEDVLIVGAGTGADLPFLPAECRVVATDLTPAMLRRARRRGRSDVALALMDGHRLGARASAFDGVVLHLILAVLPDPVLCLREAARVLRPGGRMVVFDKFVRAEARPPLALRGANLVTRVLFTEVTRNFAAILRASEAPLAVEEDAPALLGGLFRYLLLRRR
jgi:ubiquinone/menaquinone biosynthesis C-methylase UbiE